MNPRRKILVVDDDPDLVEQVSAVLGGAGYDVTTVGGLAEAEETLLSLKPDLAVIDLMMEHMDSGFVLAHRLKTLYPGTPVLLLTGVTAATGISFAATAPDARSWLKVDRILDKPVRPEQLKAEISRLLGGPEPPAKDEHDK